ncbi:hypothetical protein Pmar_PMAR016613 [Perkinsus marinus ATCC 50983]|uniref:Uncharacterized protein n=1 Tax=Perkinsus marinus (strain ATCC 50983 / TXsc) TaxID=423536 RepID=C5KTN5_PERM5|nr:hypothetical protein Pmar_PMAR016613 [Perkinsus marinus ATCC 50983]EER12214.1 hypothetical protein Pmar_PMAR016613 [Perkinsus marinus ATCC 50983]|eukprot:XP_002780419.1 hypothetical protein Pmar_PMAR016613 [Perkinsus marinus ATCC 50983]
MYSDVVDDPIPAAEAPLSDAKGNRNKRWEPQEGASIILDKLHVFGVTKMNTSEIVMYFSDLCSGNALTEGDVEMDTGGATEKEEIGVEWLDDHSCNVRCGTEDRAKAAMEHPTTTKVGDPWVLSELIELEGKKPFRLSFRLATDKDVKQAGRTWRDSQFYRQNLSKKGYDCDGHKLAPRGIDLKPRKGRRRGRSRSRSPLGGRVEVDEEELARRARRKERFGVVDSRHEGKAEEYDDDGTGSSSEEDWTKKDGRTMGILRNDDEDTPPEDQSASQ